MGLSSFFSASKQNSGEQTTFFIALLLSDSTVQAGFWQIGQGHISILERSAVFTYTDIASLLVESDKALQELGKASENVEEVIFGLEFNWVTQDGIADEKKPLLKQLTQDLSLKPVGFVVSTEALFHFLVAQDPQLSTLLIQYAVDHITVSIVNRGKLVNSERVGRSEDAGADVQEATARLLSQEEQSVLPPRIHLVSPMVSEAELKQQKNNLAEFDWKVINPKIAHQPLVEILPSETLLEAVVQEGGKAVAESLGFQVQGSLEKQLEHSPSSSRPQTQADQVGASLPIHQPPMPFKSNELVVPVAEVNESLGGDFEVPAFAEDEKVPADVSKTNPLTAFRQQWSRRFNPKAVSNNTFDKPHHTNPAVDWASHHLKFVIGGFVAGLVALLLIGYGSIATAKKALVTVTLNAKTISSDVNITLDPTIANSEPEKLLLKATLIEETFTETQTINTTGVTLVGDKAKGKVTISNKTNEPKTITAGTQLSSGGVAFTLDQEVTVASASVSQSNDGETKTYGKTEAMVTAVKIGAEGNLAAQKSMIVGTFSESSVVAETSGAFSGGSSREVRVFSEEDSEALIAEVSKKILDKAAQQFKDKSTAGQYTLPTGQLNITKRTFDAEVDDEVDSVTLTLEATVPAVTYQATDLKSLVSVALADQIPDGYALSQQDPTILSQPAAGNEKTASTSGSISKSVVVLDTNITAQVVPQFDADGFKRDISGQSPSSAEAILRGKGEVAEAVVELSPAFAKTISNQVPKNSERIELVIKN
jgi:hypothetical protein